MSLHDAHSGDEHIFRKELQFFCAPQLNIILITIYTLLIFQSIIL